MGSFFTRVPSLGWPSLLFHCHVCALQAPKDEAAVNRLTKAFITVNGLAYVAESRRTMTILDIWFLNVKDVMIIINIIAYNSISYLNTLCTIMHICISIWFGITNCNIKLLYLIRSNKEVIFLKNWVIGRLKYTLIIWSKIPILRLSIWFIVNILRLVYVFLRKVRFFPIT